MVIHSLNRPPTKLEVERHELKLRAKEMYESGINTLEIAKELGRYNTTIGLWLKEMGVAMRKRWQGQPSVVNGMKTCNDCGKKLKATRENFYFNKDEGTPRPYCKPCDKARATRTQRKSRQAKVEADFKRKRERMRYNAQSRLILSDVADILENRFPDLDIVAEIRAHLSLGKKLFHDS